MYGAKAAAIAKVALDVWAPGKTPSTRTKAAIERAVFALADNPGADIMADNDFPSILATDEFKRLAVSLAGNAFTG